MEVHPKQFAINFLISRLYHSLPGMRGKGAELIGYSQTLMQLRGSKAQFLPYISYCS